MSELAEFGDISELEALLRASILFKFEGGLEAKMFGSSPIYNAALVRLRDAIIDIVYQNEGEEQMRRVREWYRLSVHPHRETAILDFAATRTDWVTLSAAEKRRWLECVASPFYLDPDLAISAERKVDAIFADSES